MWKMTFTTIPKVTFCWQTETCLSGAVSSSNQQDAKLEERDPRQHRSLKQSTPSSFHDILWHGPRSTAAQRERQPVLLSCLSFNWSDKPARPRYFRDGTVLLSVARRWVGKACVLPTPRANAPATPAVPGLDSAREGTANHCRLCQARGFVMWADVYKGPERGQTNTYCDLSLKETQRARVRSAQMQANTIQISPPPTPTGSRNNEGRQVRCVEWEMLSSLLRGAPQTISVLALE